MLFWGLSFSLVCLFRTKSKRACTVGKDFFYFYFLFNLSGKVLGRRIFYDPYRYTFDIYPGQDIIYVTLLKSCVSWPYYFLGTVNSIAIVFKYLDKMPNKYFIALYVGLTSIFPVASRTDSGVCQPVSYFYIYVSRTGHNICHPINIMYIMFLLGL